MSDPRIIMTYNIFTSVIQERYRQEELKQNGKFPYTCADKELSDSEKYLILGEEFGEIGRSILNLSKLSNDKNYKELRSELIQIMAVCLAWIESLDNDLS